MNKWEKVEIQITNFLNNYIKKIDANLFAIHKGGMNSINPDILIEFNKKPLYFVEVKMPLSQSGQIVIEKVNEKYQLSNENYNPNSQNIIDYINKQLYNYKNISKRGIPINCNEELLAKWIIFHYKNKNCKWIIVSDQDNNNLKPQDIVIYPIEDIQKYFKISAVLRLKKSGTSHLPKKYDEIIEKELSGNIVSMIRNKEKMVVKLKETTHLKKYKSGFYLGVNYYLTKTNLTENEYYIKKLSSTNNPQIIFSLKWISDTNSSKFINFENYLKFSCSF